MATFRIRISRSAERQLKQFTDEGRRRVAGAIRALANEPFPRGCRKLTGYEDVFRIRVGPYRVLYSVNGDQLIVIVLKVGHRRNVYR